MTIYIVITIIIKIDYFADEVLNIERIGRKARKRHKGFTLRLCVNVDNEK
jgi:hypothetical protein